MEAGWVMMTMVTQGAELSCLLGMATQKILNGSWGGYDDDDYLRSGAIIFQGPACPGQKILICEVELRGLG